jgi:flagellar motor protein MotB
MATMERPERPSSVAGRAGWGDVFADTMKTALVAFVVLQIKELVDAGALDTKATAVDAVLIAVGILLVNAVIKWSRG